MTTTASVRTSTAVADPDAPQNVIRPNADGSINIGSGGGGAGTTVQGNVASGVADSGNPVKMGGVYNTVGIALVTGQRGDAQLDSNGNIKTRFVGNGVAGANGLANVLVYGTDTALNTNRPMAVALHKYNGTTWDMDRKPNATSRIPSATADTNATLAKSTAGDIWTVCGFNAAVAVRYLKIYNKATAPVVGTDVPVVTLPLPPNATFNFELGGLYLATGIAYGMTTGAADNNTGALTAGDVLGLTLTFA